MLLYYLTASKPWHGKPVLTFQEAFLVSGGVLVRALDPEACNKLEKLLHDMCFWPSIQRHEFSNRESKRKVDISEDDEHPPPPQKPKIEGGLAGTGQMWYIKRTCAIHACIRSAYEVHTYKKHVARISALHGKRKICVYQGRIPNSN